MQDLVENGLIVIYDRSQVDIRQLVYVEAVARHRHFTRAAEELHVAQSALSHQIRQLEGELGTELFERTSRRVVPTEAGEAVAARARRVVAELDGVRDEIDELRGLVRGRVAIGALLPAGGIEVTTLLARFREAFPGIEVALREGTAADMLALLEADELDAAFSLVAGELPERIAALRLSEEEVVAAYPPGAAPAKKRVAARDLSGVPLASPALGVGDQGGGRRVLRQRRRAVQRLARERRSVPDPLPGLRRLQRRCASRLARPPRGPAGRDPSAEPAGQASGLRPLAPGPPPLGGRERVHRLRPRQRRPRVEPARPRQLARRPPDSNVSPAHLHSLAGGPVGGRATRSRSATRPGSGGCCAGASRRPPGTCPIATCSGATRSSSSPRASAGRSPGSAGACGRSAATTRSWRGRRRSATGASRARSASSSPTGSRTTRAAAIVSESRVEPVDRGARWRMRALWSTVGHFQRLIGGEALTTAASRAGPRPRPVDQAPRARRPGTRGPHPPGCRS